MRLGGELKVGALHDSVNRAGFLAETTVDTLGHVNVIACSPAAAIRSWLSLNGDGLCRTDGLTELAGDATLLPRRVAAQCMLPTEAWTQWALLKGVVDGGGLPKEVA